MRSPAAERRLLLTGAVLVLVLVALQPLALGWFPVGDEAGAGIGTGDLSAGALCSMVRDLNSEGPSAAAQGVVSPVVLLVPPETGGALPLDAFRRGAAAAAPRAPRPGPADQGYPLLL